MSCLCVGLGVGLRYHPHSEEDSVSEHSVSLLRRFVTVVLAVAVAQGSEFIPIPAQIPMLLFYLLVACKIGIVIFLVVMVGFFFGASNSGTVKRQ